MIQEAIAKIAARRDLEKSEAHGAMNEIMSGQATESQVAGFLVGLRMKGETAEEIAGCAQAMREKATRITTKHKDVIDTCGTGGDGSGTFNISTTAAIIASAAGVPVAKHGNRAVSSACGSADVLKALGVNIELNPEQVSWVLDEVGISFLHAPMLHSAMKYAAPVRKQLGVRTVFNILGPLTNPAGAKRQILGVFSPELTDVMAAVLRDLGSEHALVVHGGGGLDELSTLGSSTISELKDGKVKSYSFDSSSLGFGRARQDEIQGGDMSTNADIIRRILDGQDGAPREIALLNAGAA
ncbi:MAG TPA: anthranilate phosphoribosyltransferase, partial [Bacteroidota bacterium]